jgi:small-conductance mechanosensitive channel/CRP-like cAMP-binding protein
MAAVADVVLAVLGQADPVFGGTGLIVALSILLALLILLPKVHRHKMAVPVWLLVAHVFTAGLLFILPPGYVEQRIVIVVAAFLLLASLGRGAFLLLVDTFWNRRSRNALPQILRDVLQAALFFVIGLLVLRAAGVEPGSLLTTSALLTAVIGLSLQETLGNLFAGLAIQAQRPFDVDDWIQFDETHVGRVLEINWRATRVLTIEQVEIIVPNGTLAKAPIQNFSRPTKIVRRMVEIVAPYSAPPIQVRNRLFTAVRDTPGVLASPSPTIIVRNFTDRGVAYDVRYFIDDYETRDIIDGAVRERLWYALERAQLTIPFPTRRIEFAVPESGESRPVESDAKALIAQSEMFRQLAPEDAQELVKGTTHRLYAPEERIVRQGEGGTEMFIVERGRVGVTLKGHPRAALGELGPGEFFGEMSLLTGDVRSADVVALEETQVLVLGRDAIAPLLEKNPDLMNHISQVLAQRTQSLRDTAQIAAKGEAPSEQEFLTKIRDFFKL